MGIFSPPIMSTCSSLTRAGEAAVIWPWSRWVSLQNHVSGCCNTSLSQEEGIVGRRTSKDVHILILQNLWMCYIKWPNRLCNINTITHLKIER